MAKRRRLTPNRNAIRTVSDSRVVRDDPPLIVRSDPSTGDHEPDLARVVDLVDGSQTAEGQDIANGLARTLMSELAGVRHRLAAELVLASTLGMLRGTVAEGIDGDEHHQLEAAALLLTQIADCCERAGTPVAAGLMCMLAEQGPAASRRRADEGVRRLADQGVTEPRWAQPVAFRIVRAWCYGDIFGEQMSVGVVFSQGHREHALMVLVDFNLGGGIKDAWVVEGSATQGLRERVRDGMAAEPTAWFDDIDESAALDHLRSALLCEPCPEAPDQIEDVAANLYLTRARAQQMARMLGEPDVEMYEDLAAGPQRAATGSGEVFRIKVVLQDSKPPIWRRLEVPADMSLDDLHDALQIAFDWDNSHLHRYETRSGGERDMLDDRRLHRTRLETVLREGERLRYVYDFGDSWVHVITLEERLTPDDGVVYPRCTGGRRAAPLEDSGGMWGYENLLEALIDPARPEHDHYLEWAGPIDPARFDLTAVDTALRHLARR